MSNEYIRKQDAVEKTCHGCKHIHKWENEREYGYPSPCTRCKRLAPDNYEPEKNDENA